MSDRPEHAPHKNARLWLALLLTLTVIVQGRNVMHEFVDWDDTTLVVRNPIFNPITGQHLRQMWTRPVESLYTPLTYTLWAGVTAVARLDTPDANGISLNPMIFHALNLLLHVGCVMIVFDILMNLLPLPGRKKAETRHNDKTSSSSEIKRCAQEGTLSPHLASPLRGEGPNVFAAGIGAAVFAVHPLQVEAVAWISGMNNLLAGLFSLACIAAYVRSTRRRSPARGRNWFLLAASMFLLALFSKPTAIVTPLLLVVIDRLLVRRSWRRIAWSIAPFVLLAIPFVIVGRQAQPAGNTFTPPAPQRLVVAGDAIGWYFQKLVWPANLLIDYGHRPAMVIASHGSMGTWIAFAIAILLAAITWRRAPWVSAGLLVFVAGITLVLGFIPFDFQDYSTVADRYVYLSMLGIGVIISGFIGQINWSLKRPVHANIWLSGLSAIVVIIAMSVASFQHIATWNDTETLAHYTLSENPTSMASFTMLSYLAERRGDIPTALKYLEQGLSHYPDDANFNRNYANLLRPTNPAKAIPYFRQAYLHGDHEIALINNWGTALLDTGHVTEAIDAFNLVLAQDPNHLNSHINLGHAYLMLGNADEAEQHLKRALEINPQSTAAAKWMSQVSVLRNATSRPIH